ncbi:hypothetical protein M409DRAFT_57376 [Zasmidium cellare ATCC 36951]|uniref:Uncharacterized protein n=1 Tax=Zasmidium cellare ATCC 36951 TaxID=1080233 RepID=A0A6A6C8V3_ZASCE|nr:uncharacterized protein M409DRAFT_57376 [Zasmidium cellare ATCC 36951]KAF2163471.1 hypothetical protein M409DRAFT_57376 [Zasmidium cellare ATCC 36951]
MHLLNAATPLSGVTVALAVPTPPPQYKEDLDWQPCQLDFPPSLQQRIPGPIDCATLDVPLDYTNNDTRRLQLQLIKVNATQHPSEGRVVFAPGGPGNSGVEEVARLGSVYQRILGGRYDVVGFDPRGVGRTIPFSCAPTNATTKRSVAVNNRTIEIPQIDSWSLLKNKAWEEGSAFNELCYTANHDTGRFLSTAFVARDLLAISKAINPDGLLRFWGRSYGTILGQTFAAMFPDRVERMVLDSVVLASDYYSGQWISSSRDTTRSLAHFFQECIAAGPNSCPLANFTGSAATPEDLTQALYTALDKVRIQNLTLTADYPSLAWWQSGEGLPLLGELKYGLLANLYRPDQYPLVFQYINDTLHGNFSSFTDLTIADALANAPSEEPWSQGINAFHGVACLDSSLRVSRVEDLYNSVQAQLRSGGTFADIFSSQVWPCAQWKFEAAERYEGGFADIRTRHPVLLVNSPFDPITPLSGAFEAATAFPGSRVLVHKGHGHGSNNHPNLCTLRAIGDYFRNGELPDVGTECEPGKNGWEMIDEAVRNNGVVTVREEVRDEDEREMLQSVYDAAVAAVVQSSAAE